MLNFGDVYQETMIQVRWWRPKNISSVLEMNEAVCVSQNDFIRKKIT